MYSYRFTSRNHDLHITCIVFPLHAWTDWFVPNFHPSIHLFILIVGVLVSIPAAAGWGVWKAQMVCDTVNLSNVPSDVQQLWPHLVSATQSSEAHNKPQRGSFLRVSSALACQLFSTHRINFSILRRAFLHLCSVFLMKLMLLTPPLWGFLFFSHLCVHTIQYLWHQWHLAVLLIC